MPFLSGALGPGPPAGHFSAPRASPPDPNPPALTDRQAPPQITPARPLNDIPEALWPLRHQKYRKVESTHRFASISGESSLAMTAPCRGHGLVPPQSRGSHWAPTSDICRAQAYGSGPRGTAGGQDPPPTDWGRSTKALLKSHSQGRWSCGHRAQGTHTTCSRLGAKAEAAFTPILPKI